MLFAQTLGMQQAQELASQAVDTGAIQPVIDAIKPIIGVISAIVGGLFGLYLIMVLMRAYYERKRYMVLKDIRYDLDYLNQHFGLPYSQKKPHRLYRKVMPLEELRKMEQNYQNNALIDEMEKRDKQQKKQVKK
jgi:hypothetical protein